MIDILNSMSEQMRKCTISHRGETKYSPENTLPAFERALEDGATGIECDLQCTRDGVLVVMHDSDIRRTTTGWDQGLASYNISDLDWSFVASLDAGSWFSGAFSGTKVPLLEEILTMRPTITHGKICYIDVKETAATERAISRLACVLKRHCGTTGFDVHVGMWTLYDLSIANALRMDRYARLSFISDRLPEQTERFNRLRLSSFNIAHDQLTKKWVSQTLSEGFTIFAHVPNSDGEKETCREHGVSGIITDVL